MEFVNLKGFLPVLARLREYGLVIVGPSETTEIPCIPHRS